MIEINFRVDFRELENKLNSLVAKEIPFAAALALTQLAADVKDAEQDSMRSVFDRPTAFTEKSMGIVPARKGSLVAKVFVRDIAAAYLEPFEFGGRHSLGQKQGLLKPVNQATNAFGNLPRGAIARLKSKPGVFVGAVKTRGGDTIRGVWQRPYYRPKGQAKGKSKLARGTNTTGRLKLLVRFADAGEVTPRWDYRERADRILKANFEAAFAKAMARALA